MSGSSGDDLYDFANHEQLFFCVDALTRAVAALAQNDPHLAGELTRITNSILAMAERAAAPRRPPPPGAEPVDLLRRQDEDPGPAAGDGEGIIDVLTGERI
ncbi:MAG: hypothetical protein AB1568_14090 [Thermodesulfobacteriota bacterium]